MALAHDEARRLDHDYTGTEHLILGLLREDEERGTRVSISLGVSLDEMRKEVETVAGRGDKDTGGRTGPAPFTLRAKKVLTLALGEALQLGYKHVDPEHLLLGLASEGEGTAMLTLSNFGVGQEEMYRGAMRALSRGWAQRSREARLVGARARSPEDAQSAEVRARVEALVIHARCGVSVEERALPQALRIDLDYSYEAGEGDDLEKIVDYGSVVRGVANLLEEGEFQLLETGMRMAGWYVLNSFPEIWEVTVRVTKLHVPIARAVSGISVEATFSR